jgi:hypothetical protein
VGYQFAIGSSYQHLLYQQMAVTSTARLLSDLVTVPAEAVTVRMQPTGAGIRYRHNTSPMANTGNLMSSGDVEYPAGPVADIRVIREASTDAVLNLDFQGHKA